MGIYKTYREAVLAKGSTEGIYTPHKEWTGKDKSWIGQFVTKDTLTVPMVGYGKWVECNPADHLDTLEDFRDNDKKLEASDIVTLLSGEVFILSEKDPEVWNEQSDNDDKRFILQAAADQVETPEKKEAFDRIPNQATIDAMNSEAEKGSYNSASEAFDAIDTTPQQVESLGKWIPKSGQTVYIAQINTLAGVKEERYFVVQFWCNSKHQREYLDCGILFPTKEEAEIKTKTMLGIPIETPAEREERERLEAAYNLYCAVENSEGDKSLDFDSWEELQGTVKRYLFIVDKTGYRKKKEDK